MIAQNLTWVLTKLFDIACLPCCVFLQPFLEDWSLTLQKLLYRLLCLGVLSWRLQWLQSGEIPLKTAFQFWDGKLGQLILGSEGNAWLMTWLIACKRILLVFGVAIADLLHAV